MKVFFNKWKKANLVLKGIYLIIFLSYWIAYGFFCKSILSLVGIETFIRTFILILFAIYGLIYTMFGIVKLFQNKKVAFTILSIFTILFAIIFGFGSYYIDKLYHKIDGLTTKEQSIYTTVLLGLKDQTYQSDMKIGMITDEQDRTGYILPLEFMKKENMDHEIEYFSNYMDLLEALYSKKVDAIFITKDYVTIYSGEVKYQNIAVETTILKKYEKEMKTEESELLVSTKNLTEPFTVLVLGVDSDSPNGLDANAAFNGDTLMLITFNPKTLTATMFSVPRDMYVPIINSYGRNIGYNKINSSAAYGTASTVNTMENLTGIEIDYFVKVNFRGVIDLVNNLGGIDVDVEPPNYSYYIQSWGEGRLCESDENRTYINPVCMNTGWQHLDGRQALAYARNRHGYLESDIARNRHQQQIIEAIAKKLIQTANFSDFEKLLDTISNNIATNMTTSQVLSFYQSLKGMLVQALSGGDFISIQKTQLSYFGFKNQYGLDCLGYYKNSLDAIVNAMKENLGLVSTETIKTFHYDYSDDFEQNSEIIGKGIYSGGKVPDSSITSIYQQMNDNKQDKDKDDDEPNSKDDDNDKDDGNDNGNNSNQNQSPEEDNNGNSTTPDEPNNDNNQDDNNNDNDNDNDNGENSSITDNPNDNNSSEVPGTPEESGSEEDE